VSPVPLGLYALEHEPYDEGAPIVVLVHGAMDRSAAFGRVVQLLSDLHVVVYDRRGYARSARAEPVAASLDDHAEDLLAILDGRTATIVGHSYGGAVAMLVAHRQPDVVRAIGVFEAPVPWMSWWPAEAAGSTAGQIMAANGGPGEAAELFVRGQLGDRAWDDLPPQTQAERRAEGGALLSDLRSLSDVDPPLFDPAELASPMIVGRGGASLGYHRVAAERLAGTAGAELVDIEGAGHAAHTTHPDQFARLVRRTVGLSRPR
jgi:pimeloyl-ACP methyl ester carboxylesterase